MEHIPSVQYLSRQSPFSHNYRPSVEYTKEKQRVVQFAYSKREAFKNPRAPRPPKTPGVGAYETIEAIER